MNSVPLDELVLSFVDGVSLRRVDGTIVLTLPGGEVRLQHLPPAVFSVVNRLGGAGITRRQFVHEAGEYGVNTAARLHYELSRLERYGLVTYTSRYGGRPIAELRPTSPGFRPTDVSRDAAAWQLSRFAYSRTESGDTLLESPRGHAVVTLIAPGAAAVTAALAKPRDIASLLEIAAVHLPGISECELRTFLALLELAAAALPVDAGGLIDEATDPVLRMWSFHDLLFHARSRVGRHNQRAGDTFRFVGEIPPPTAARGRAAATLIDLERPDLNQAETADPPFTRVLERRRSVRTYSDSPITLSQLAAFLYRSARVKEQYVVNVSSRIDTLKDRQAALHLSRRPSPGGGALHELETYLAVHQCLGLDRGLYHYDAWGHRLAHIDCSEDALQALLQDAVSATRLSQEPHILIVLAARFSRANWKYESIAYSTTLKNAGALIQTMYLVATAMGLAPTALGCGNSDRFAEAAGTDYYAESSVAEFLLGSRAADETG